MEKKKKRRVWVFGAGITGLTAAHELVERNFEVIVVEPEKDQRWYAEPAVGGVARTQWGVFTEPPCALPGGEMGRVNRLLPPLAVTFKGKTATMTAEGEAALNKYRTDLQDIHGQWKPHLLVHGTSALDPDIVIDRLEVIEKELTKKPGGVDMETTNDTPPYDPDIVHLDPERVDVFAQVVPAEHGFRYFPAFYRHIFDTMSRIRLLDDHQLPTARPFQTVLGNLVPTKAINIAVERPPPKQYGEGEDATKRTVTIPRSPPRALRDVQNTVKDVLEKLGYQADDLLHLATKITHYMTSGPKRRKTYEGITWEQFLDVGRLSERAREHAQRAPEILVGMLAKESDARTQGNCAVQLVLDQIVGSTFSDATLNAPTTSAWFNPWRDYLKRQGVQFREGKLTGFTKISDDEVHPTIVYGDGGSYKDDFKEGRFVLAVPLQAMLPSNVAGDSEGKVALGLCSSFISVCTNADTGDFGRLDKWIEKVGGDWPWNGTSQSKGPFRHMSGIQYYFETDAHPTKGHTLYLDSPWRLSSISPLGFWTRAAVPRDGFRGMISVDIGEWYGEDNKKAAWTSTRDEIAKVAWDQITRSVGDKSRFYPQGVIPLPASYHLDDYLVLEGDKPKFNTAPYLITRPQDWPLRPGRLDRDRPTQGYEVTCGWVLAGTYMKTFTRLTTMESACESARHAINGLLHELKFEGPLCDIFDMEQYELPDLHALRDFDDKLVDAGLPHTLDIVAPDAAILAMLAHLL